MNKQSFRIRNTGTIMFLARLFGCYDVINDVILNVPYYLHVQVIWHTVLCLWEKIRKFKNSFLCSKTHLWHVYNVKMPNWTRNESNLNLIIFSIKLHTPFHITCTLLTKKATLQCMWNPIKLKHSGLCCCVWSIHPMGFLNIQTFEFTPSKHFCDSTFCEFPFFTSGQKIACIFTHHVRFWWLT